MAESRVLYHKSQQLYKPGEHIVSGNWGRTVLGFGPIHHLYFREYLFESIRSREFTDKPSRLVSAFAFIDGRFAMAWQRSQTVENTYIVSLSDPTRPIHQGDMTWIDQLPLCRTFEEVEDCARQYWKGEMRQSGVLEIVAPCDLIVEKRLPQPGIA